MADETAWLIEETWSGYVHYVHRDFDAEAWRRETASLRALPFVWVASGSGGATLTRRKAKTPFITKNVEEAMRFPTPEAADSWRSMQPLWFRRGDQYQVREHMWPEPA